MTHFKGYMQQVDPFIPINKKCHSLPQGQYGTQWLRKPDNKQAGGIGIAKSLPPRKPVGASSPRILSRPARSIDGLVHKPSPLRPKPTRQPIGQAPPVAPRVSIDILRSSGRIGGRSPTTAAKPSHPVATTPVASKALQGKTGLSLKHRYEESIGTYNKLIHIIRGIGMPAVVVAAILLGVLVQLLFLGEIAIAAYAIYAFTRRVASRTTFLLALIGLLSVVILLALHGQTSLSENFAVYVFLLLVTGTISFGLELRNKTA